MLFNVIVIEKKKKISSLEASNRRTHQPKRKQPARKQEVSQEVGGLKERMVEYLPRGWLRAVETPERINKAPSSWTMLVGGWVAARECGITSKGDVHSFCVVIPPSYSILAVYGWSDEEEQKEGRAVQRQDPTAAPCSSAARLL
jgi:hypothetical protein